MSILKKGDFVRVRDTAQFRAGQDGMVVQPDDGESVALVFGSNRYNETPTSLGICCTMLPEEWLLSELDLTSIER